MGIFSLKSYVISVDAKNNIESLNSAIPLRFFDSTMVEFVASVFLNVMHN